MCPYDHKSKLVWRKATITWNHEDPYNMICEECSTHEGKFILVVDIGKTEKDQDYETEEYYCLDCFKRLMNS
jgi:hypothetical protein